MDEDQVELIRRRLTDEVREHVEKDLRRRYSWLGLIAVILTSGVVTLIVNQALTDARVKLAAAEEVQKQNSTSLAEAIQEAGELTNRFSSAEKKFQATAEKAERRLNEVSEEANALTKTVSDVSTIGFQLSEDVRRDVERLSNIVESLVAEGERSQERTQELEAQLSSVRKSLTTARIGISTATARAELAQFPVRVTDIQGAERLIDFLKNAGFSVSLFTNTIITIKTARGIVIDSDMPADVARELIRISRGVWPFLNYVIFTDFEPTTGTIIGAYVSHNSWLETHARPLTDRDFDRLLSPTDSDEEFIMLVRSFEGR